MSIEGVIRSWNEWSDARLQLIPMFNVIVKVMRMWWLIIGYVILSLGSFVCFYVITYTGYDVVNLSWELIEGMLFNFNVDVIPSFQGHCSDR